MGSVQKGKFKLPLTKEDEKQFNGNDKVCVIGIIGKSAFESRDCKAVSIDQLLHRIIFQLPVTSGEVEHNVSQMDDIEGYYDTKNRTIYLHMVGIFDSHRLVMTCQSLAVELETKGFLHSWADMKYSQAKTLLFLFSISHIIMIVHPVPIFDVGYVHLFRAIDGIRQKAQVHLSEVLKECPVSDDWVQAGRPCSPRALFIFQSPFSEPLEDASKAIQGNRHSRQKVPPIKKLEHALEDQIYRILRKSRVITNISMNSLFAIPANQEFVYVHTAETQRVDPVTYLMRQLREQCLMSLDDSLPTKSKDQTSSVEINGTLALTSSLGNKETDHSFKTFLEQHLELAFTKGFDDNVGRHSGMSVFELPTSKTWYTVANSIYKLFFTDDFNSAMTKDVLCALKSQIDVDGRFSEARCLKVLPVAAAAYQEGLPLHYSSEVHHSQLSQAYRMFSLHARGPAFERYAEQLREECEKFWKNGHQLCEIHSLTGNPCLKSIHRLPTDPEEPEPTDGRPLLSVTSHCSQIKLTSACNCGRKQSGRDDPFDSKAANYEFYEQLARSCCHQLESYTFPVFKPSTTDFKAAKISVTHRATSSAVPKKDISSSGREERDLGPGMSLPLSLGQSLGTSGEDIDSNCLSLHPDPSPQEINKIEGILSISDLTATCNTNDKEDKTLIRQVSTTEYLPGMLHSDSPTGLLPSFPSWSLVCLGPSSLYSHNIGIQDQPGFITSTNFLLPWDVTVKTENKDKWPTIAETSGKKGHSLKGKKGGRDSSEFTVKIFLGIEYECPRGHRFMCSAPEKILKATGLGLVKENAGKITSCDMPLYFPCPCRSGKPITAQLMRIHVVTPKAPVHVTLDPKVQPAPPPCPVFFPGNQEPVKLSQSTYWVLRLPFIYEGEQEPYLPPKDKKIPMYGKLLKGMFNVLQIMTDK